MAQINVMLTLAISSTQVYKVRGMYNGYKYILICGTYLENRFNKNNKL